MPVVVSDFVLLDFIIFPDFILGPVAPGPTLPSLEAPGAGWVCADAIAVAPNREATTRAEMASLDRIRILLGWWMQETKLATSICVPEEHSFPGNITLPPCVRYRTHLQKFASPGSAALLETLSR
jgi:hypothetical protein